MNTPSYTYAAKIDRVIDGDTIDLSVDLGFRIIHGIRTRLMGMDAPEVSTPEGKAARDWLRGIAPMGMRVTVTTYRDPTDKYGRWLATIHLADGTSLNDFIISTGHAVAKEYA